MLQDIEVDDVYRNTKTKGWYVVLGFCTNTTNAQDGQQMVRY